MSRDAVVIKSKHEYIDLKTHKLRELEQRANTTNRKDQETTTLKSTELMAPNQNNSRNLRKSMNQPRRSSIS